MIGSVNIIRRVSRVSPNNVATLRETVQSRSPGLDLEPMDSTLTHILALPTQLRNNLARSFLEKNRSNT